MKKNNTNKDVKALTRFINSETLSGIVLITSAIIALIWSNSGSSDSYFHLWDKTYFTIGFDNAILSKPLYYWINDGLMAIFFFVIGLEIKREIMVGELSNLRKATLPVFAAVGGILLPALIYVGLNRSEALLVNGWAIPTATDIAFSLGILALLGSRVPVALKVFLTALAIVDDLGAILGIAFFYTEDISFVYLFIAIAVTGLLFVLNRLDVRNLTIYLLLGILGIWLPMLLSGVHATIAGVLLAFTIPAHRKLDHKEFSSRIKNRVSTYENLKPHTKPILLTGEQMELIESMKTQCEKAESPLQRIEEKTHKLALFFIMPLFALANTGVAFSEIAFDSILSSSLTWGIFLGLFVGKPLGILLMSWLSVRLNIASLPEGIKFKHLFGVGVLAGVGFTMSLFITELAFHGDLLLDTSKVAIFSASLLSGLLGFLLLKMFLKAKPA
jgi:NhaA family Na+:H+ antiporter